VRRLFTTAAFLLAALAGGGLAWLHAGNDWAPPFEQVVASWRPSEAYLLDRHGEVIHQRRVDLSVQRRPWTRLDEVSPALVGALLTAEDRRFHEHGGVDWRAVGAAALDGLRGNPVRGASTLTMQLASLLEGVLVIWLYWRSINAQGIWLQRREQAILEIVTQRAE